MSELPRPVLDGKAFLLMREAADVGPTMRKRYDATFTLEEELQSIRIANLRNATERESLSTITAWREQHSSSAPPAAKATGPGLFVVDISEAVLKRAAKQRNIYADLALAQPPPEPSSASSAPPPSSRSRVTAWLLQRKAATELGGHDGLDRADSGSVAQFLADAWRGEGPESARQLSLPGYLSPPDAGAASAVDDGPVLHYSAPQVLYPSRSGLDRASPSVPLTPSSSRASGRTSPFLEPPSPRRSAVRGTLFAAPSSRPASTSTQPTTAVLASGGLGASESKATLLRQRTTSSPSIMLHHVPLQGRSPLTSPVAVAGGVAADAVATVRALSVDTAAAAQAPTGAWGDASYSPQPSHQLQPNGPGPSLGKMGFSLRTISGRALPAVLEEEHGVAAAAAATAPLYAASAVSVAAGRDRGASFPGIGQQPAVGAGPPAPRDPPGQPKQSGGTAQRFSSGALLSKLIAMRGSR